VQIPRFKDDTVIPDDELPQEYRVLRGFLRRAHRSLTGDDTPMEEWTNAERSAAHSLVFAHIAQAIWELPEASQCQ
jgi:hypothetical protein